MTTEPGVTEHAADRCGVHYERHPTMPHLVAVCDRPYDHEGEHSNVLLATTAAATPEPICTCPEGHEAQTREGAMLAEYCPTHGTAAATPPTASHDETALTDDERKEIRRAVVDEFVRKSSTDRHGIRAVVDEFVRKSLDVSRCDRVVVPVVERILAARAAAGADAGSLCPACEGAMSAHQMSPSLQAEHARHSADADAGDDGLRARLAVCNEPHGNPSNAARVYGHHASVRHCIRLRDTDQWVYDPAWEA